ncbi:MAG: mandelate racemase [Chloroflexi bacterium]|nr:mandelate racemase [Chloroflexota bacterium]
MTTIRQITTRDVRFPLKDGAGSDAVHNINVYSYPITELHTDNGLQGTGIVLTLAGGNELLCRLIEQLAESLLGQEIEELMADYGRTLKSIADHPQYRWLGPHKGMVHLALASITNACFDLWAKSRGIPLWRLLLDLSPEQIVNLLDLSYIEDVLTYTDALYLLKEKNADRLAREQILQTGYPGYDTSIGWFNYSDQKVKDNIKKAVDQGFSAMKLKVGSKDPIRDIRRAYMVREAAGEKATIILDCNQQWTLPQSLRLCPELADMNPYWIEEPTHPDDVLAHQTLVRAIVPMKVALGEHVPNRVLFKNFMQAGALYFVQADCTRLAGISEFITVSLLARKFNLPIVPHVGDMGQIHQHLVLFNHIALGHEALLLEYIPHMRDYFVQPAVVEGGVYQTPQEPGSSSDMVEL